MSVILTACRKNVGIAAKNAKKAKQRRRMQQAEQAALVSRIGPVPKQTDTVRVWTFLLDDDPYCIVFYKDSLDVTVNNKRVETFADFTSTNVTSDFLIDEHQGQVTVFNGQSSQAAAAPVHLTVDGCPVPE